MTIFCFLTFLLDTSLHDYMYFNFCFLVFLGSILSVWNLQKKILNIFNSNYSLFFYLFYLRPPYMTFLCFFLFLAFVCFCGNLWVFEIFENSILNNFQFWLHFAFWTFFIWGLLTLLLECFEFIVFGCFKVIFEFLKF